MKTIIIIISGLFLCYNAGAQKIQADSLFFPEYTKDLKSMLLYKPVVPEKSLMLYKTAAVIAGTFLINEAIIRHDENCGSYENTTLKTGTIFLVGITMSVVVFHFELSKYKEKNNGLTTFPNKKYIYR